MRKNYFTIANRHLVLPFFFCFLLFSFSCNRDLSSESVKVEGDELEVGNPKDTTLFPVEKEIEPQIKISYHLDSLETAGKLDSLFAGFNEDQRRTIYALNRIEPVRVGVGTNLVFPDTLTSDFLTYAPFPKRVKFLDTIPKTVLINQRTQAFALYEEGELVHWGPVSSGKQSTPTPNGLHYGNYKAKHKISTVNPAWELPYYFNFMNFEGVGVHQYLLPGFPASHACVRLYMEDAQFIYDWAKQWQLDPSGRTVIRNGTPFMVFGEYDYKDQAPWLKLSLDNESNNLTDAELETLKAYVEEYLQDEKNFEQSQEEEEAEAVS